MPPKKPSVNSIILSNLETLNSKMDSMGERMNKIEVTAARQEQNVREHMRRCDLLEKRDDKIEKDIAPLIQDRLFRKRNWKIIGYASGVIAALGGAVEGINLLLHWLTQH